MDFGLILAAGVATARHSTCAAGGFLRMTTIEFLRFRPTAAPDGAVDGGRSVPISS